VKFKRFSHSTQHVYTVVISSKRNAEVFCKVGTQFFENLVALMAHKRNE